MEYQAWLWVTTTPRHGQRILDQGGLHVRLEAAAHHLATEHVDDRSQVQSALVGGDVGDVATPQLVGHLGVEAPLHEVRCHRQQVNPFALDARCGKEAWQKFDPLDPSTDRWVWLEAHTAFWRPCDVGEYSTFSNGWTAQLEPLVVCEVSLD